MVSDADGRPELDTLPTVELVRRLVEAEARVVPAVLAQSDAVAAAVDVVVERWRAGGRWVFVGAGTSGRIAAAEAAELPGTFGLERSRIVARVAGGEASTDRDEDDLAHAETDRSALDLHARDAVIAVAASGSTPYTLTLARGAVAAGAAVVAVVTVAGSPLTELGPTVAVDVGPELLRESTRLGAGTAQKIVLNTLTTAAMARLGHVHGDLMIDVQPANAKLRRRAAAIVADIAGCAPEQAGQALAACADDARAAVLHLVLGLDPKAARGRAAAHSSLRAALAAGRSHPGNA